jgi:hypothetical protein
MDHEMRGRVRQARLRSAVDLIPARRPHNNYVMAYEPQNPNPARPRLSHELNLVPTMVNAAAKAKIRLGLTPSHDQVDDQDDKQHTANPASDYRAAIIVSTASTKEKKQDDNDQNDVHAFALRLLTLSFLSPQLTGPSVTFVSHGRNATTIYPHSAFWPDARPLSLTQYLRTRRSFTL